MSASLVRKALDETTLASEEKFDNLSKVSRKRFKSPKKVKKLSKEKLLKHNLKVLKALDCEVRHKPQVSSSQNQISVPVVEKEDKSLKKLNSKKKKKGNQSDGSVFTDEDFEKFEKEYFVTH